MKLWLITLLDSRLWGLPKRHARNCVVPLTPAFSLRLSREGGNPEVYRSNALPHWIPAFAGMTIEGLPAALRYVFWKIPCAGMTGGWLEADATKYQSFRLIFITVSRDDVKDDNYN